MNIKWKVIEIGKNLGRCEFVTPFGKLVNVIFHDAFCLQVFFHFFFEDG